MQNAGFAALGLNCRYLAFDVPPERLREAVMGAQAMGFVGLNLTVPHKQLALGFVELLDESARFWGAVNTLRFEGQDAAGDWRPMLEWGGESPQSVRARGYNTDADAIARSVVEDLGLTLGGARVLLLGAGGAGRTAALKLAQEGVAVLYLVNRTEFRAVALGDEIRRRFPEVVVEVGYPVGAVDLVLNATSLGLRSGDDSPLESTRLGWNRVGAVYDMIYRPAETRLLREARAAGCRVSNGMGMLLYQGASAFELWTGRPAPVDTMRLALEHNLYGGLCN